MAVACPAAGLAIVAARGASAAAIGSSFCAVTLPAASSAAPSRMAARASAAPAAVEAQPPALSPADFCGVDGVALPRPELGPAPHAAANGKRYHIHTFGCQMNLADSERMAGILEVLGYQHSASPDDADVLIYNTCSIRDKSEQKVYSALGTQRQRKRDNPAMKIVVAGCVAQQEGETLLRRVPEVDLVMGPQHANRLHHLLDQVDLGSQVCAVEPRHILEDIATPRRDSSVTAWVNVIYGCNERCTYCVVPGVRGLEQSRRPEDIRREMLALGEAGYKEVTLLGQNIDAYGRDLGGSAADGSGRREWTLTDLLHYVHSVPGIERIRFATSHPRFFSERLIKACAELPKICKYFHIPFQSGNNDILKAMGRGYTAERYKHIIQMVRKYMPDASISADCIVGFPGETEEQFQHTLQLMEDLKFDLVNTAAYSPRPGTPAAEWDNQVAELIKMDRLQRINRLVIEHAMERNQRYSGRVEKVLVEKPNPKPGQEDQVMGRIDSNRLTFFKGGRDLIGQIVDVSITEVRPMSLSGELVT
eukprot:SM000142S00560  [mRNA]  locus=s142:290061:294112:- [translate_table: standard]